MQIKSKITLAEIEHLHVDKDVKEIVLPQTFRKLRIGLLPRLVQFLITKLKKNPSITVNFYQLDLDSEDAITKLLSDPHATSALLMADNVISKGGEELKSKINQNLVERFSISSIMKRGQRLQLLAIDHSIREFAYPRCFYMPAGTDTLRGADFYTQLLHRFLSTSAKMSNLDNNEISRVGELIYELIENTEQHGKTEFITGKSKKSIRGLVIDYRLITKDANVDDITGTENLLNRYIREIREDDTPLHLIEISIYDSGAGIVRSFTQKNTLVGLTLEQEVSYLQKAFNKGISSKPIGTGYGRGLNNVKEILSDRRSYINIRTGRLSLIRNFDSAPLTADDEQELRFFDEQHATVKERHEVEGTSYSILVPIK